MRATLELDWRPVHLDPSWGFEDDPILWIELAKFDLEWRKGDQWVGPGGTPGGQDDRYPRAGDWLLKGQPTDMLQIWINDRGMGFTDGRHRFAWLRDHGCAAIPVQLSPDSLAYGVSAIETDLRQSLLPLPAK